MGLLDVSEVAWIGLRPGSNIGLEHLFCDWDCKVLDLSIGCKNYTVCFFFIKTRRRKVLSRLERWVLEEQVNCSDPPDLFTTQESEQALEGGWELLTQRRRSFCQISPVQECRCGNDWSDYHWNGTVFARNEDTVTRKGSSTSFDYGGAIHSITYFYIGLLVCQNAEDYSYVPTLKARSRRSIEWLRYSAIL